MKDSFKKRIHTKEKENIFTALSADDTIQRLTADCMKAGASQLHLMCLVVYCYQLGLETGYANGVTAGKKSILAYMDKVTSESQKNGKE